MKNPKEKMNLTQIQFTLKTFFVLTLLVFAYPLTAQDLIERTKLDLPYKGLIAKENYMHQLVQAAATNNFAPVESSLFTLTTNAALVASSDLLAEENVLFLAVNENSLDIIRTKGLDFLRLQIPVAPEKFIELELIKSNVKSPDYLAESSTGAAFTAASEPVFYRGVVKGESNSLAAISIFENSIRGLIMDDDGNYELGKVSNGEEYALFNTLKLTTPPFFDCHVDDSAEEDLTAAVENQVNAQNATIGAVDIYLETDFAMYGNFGNNKAAVETFVMGMFNEMATIYQNEQIPIQISKIVVWESMDPYAAGSTSANATLQAFETNRPKFEGVLALLLSGKAQAGGLAGLDRLCNPTAHGLTLLTQTTFQPYPTYSNWVNVTAHELGHLFGSRHTHRCAWGPNGNQAIDNCVPTEGGNCSLVTNPTPPAERGTIMSYCHTVQNGDFNLNKGFGTEPGNLMRNRYQNALCRLNCDHLPTPLSAIATSNCQPQTSPTGLGAGFGGLISVTIGGTGVVSSLTVSDQNTFGGNGYLDFTTDCYKAFALDANTTYNVAVQTWFNNHNVKGWIDYNNNNQFEDPAERIFDVNTGNRNANNITSGTTSFTVSSSALTNTSLRIRFLCDLANVSGPCYNPTHGQCEDYPLMIKSTCASLAGKVITANPVSGTQSAAGIVSTSGTVTVNGTASFISGAAVVLNNGFQASIGSTFTASIDQNLCNGAFVEEENYRMTNPLLENDEVHLVSDLTIMPNPFSQQTNLAFALKKESTVSVQVYDLNGQLIESLVQNQRMSQGVNNLAYRTQNLSAGMYYIFLKADGEVQTKKIVVLD